MCSLQLLAHGVGIRSVRGEGEISFKIGDGLGVASELRKQCPTVAPFVEGLWCEKQDALDDSERAAVEMRRHINSF